MGNSGMYMVVQLNLTPEILKYYMVFERSISIFSMTSLKQHRCLPFPELIPIGPPCTSQDEQNYRRRLREFRAAGADMVTRDSRNPCSEQRLTRLRSVQ